jgi:Cobalamin biosynthesis protein CobT
MQVNNRVLILREAITRIIPMLTQRSVKVTQQGTQAFVSYHRRTLEIERVNLPYIPDDADDTLLDATQGFLDHEVGHILFTDQKIVLKAEKQGVHSLHNMIEDTFTESGEFIEAILPSLLGQPVDKVNLLEEQGDSSWYGEIALDELGYTRAQSNFTNIKKLTDKKAGRYKKGAFDPNAAVGRDVSKERRLLEAGAEAAVA